MHYLFPVGLLPVHSYEAYLCSGQTAGLPRKQLATTWQRSHRSRLPERSHLVIHEPLLDQSLFEGERLLSVVAYRVGRRRPDNIGHVSILHAPVFSFITHLSTRYFAAAQFINSIKFCYNLSVAVVCLISSVAKRHLWLKTQLYSCAILTRLISPVMLPRNLSKKKLRNHIKVGDSDLLHVFCRRWCFLIRPFRSIRSPWHTLAHLEHPSTCRL